MAREDRRMGTRLGLSPVVVLLLFLIPSGCGEESLPSITPEESALAVQEGEAAVGELQRTLVARLTAALEEGGPAYAVEFCSSEALPLTAAVQDGLDPGMVLKRTSFRYRNPRNAPDSAEELALRYFEDAIVAGGEVPSRYVQRASESELRYYQPLFVGEFCLRCHGDPEGMDPEALEAVNSHYPADLAKGYSAGDFRGVVRVSIPVESGDG